MSIVPTNGNEGRSNLFSDDPFSLAGLWDSFLDFPFPLPLPSPSPLLSRTFPELGLLGATRNSRLDWSETAGAHVLRASLPGFSGEDVLVELQDDRMLQISTDSGSFLSRFKLPNNARIDQLSAFMDGGVLTVTVPKEEARRPEVRVVEITGDD